MECHNCFRLYHQNLQPNDTNFPSIDQAHIFAVPDQSGTTYTYSCPLTEKSRKFSHLPNFEKEFGQESLYRPASQKSVAGDR